MSPGIELLQLIERTVRTGHEYLSISGPDQHATYTDAHTALVAYITTLESYRADAERYKRQRDTLQNVVYVEVDRETYNVIMKRWHEAAIDTARQESR
jgi:hypothetical protein